MTTPRGQRIGARNVTVAILAVGAGAPAIARLIDAGDLMGAISTVIALACAAIAGTIRERD